MIVIKKTSKRKLILILLFRFDLANAFSFLFGCSIQFALFFLFFQDVIKIQTCVALVLVDQNLRETVQIPIHVNPLCVQANNPAITMEFVML